ncbi:unnamed protein product [Tenebrio molitor]|nr:unnamed protein product [Tenebrio molitor]
MGTELSRRPKKRIPGKTLLNDDASGENANSGSHLCHLLLSWGQELHFLIDRTSLTLTLQKQKKLSPAKFRF